MKRIALYLFAGTAGVFALFATITVRAESARAQSCGGTEVICSDSCVKVCNSAGTDCIATCRMMPKSTTPTKPKPTGPVAEE